jgi:hypothetical protein
MARPSWDNPALLADLRDRQPSIETPYQLLWRLENAAQQAIEYASNAGQNLSYAEALVSVFNQELDKYN